MELLRLQDNNIECTKNLIHFPICACHPYAGAMLIFSVSFQFYQMFPEGKPRSPPSSLLFRPTLPTPPMPGASKWGQILFSNALVLVLLQGVCARRESNPRAQAWEACMLPLFYRPHDTSQETRQWLLRIAPLPFYLFLPLKQHSAAAKCLTARGFEPLRAELNGFLVHVLGHLDTLSCLFLPPIVHLHQPGIEPGSHRWQRCIPPLDH